MPKVVDHDQRRTEIVLNARELIGERGAAAMTLRNLAERCGLANGALRRYFRFKHDVLLALDEDLAQRFEQFAAGEGYASQRGVEALWTVLDSVLPLDRERAISAEVVATLRDQSLGTASFATSFHQRSEALFTRLLGHLEEAVGDGELEPRRDPKVTAALLVNTVVGINMTSSVGVHRGLGTHDLAAIEAIIDTA